MTTTQVSNGKLRKSLAEEIDRLDRILDGLAETLNESVATAVKEAMTVAVQAVLTELLANPDVLARLRESGEPAETPPSGPTLVSRLVGKCGSWLCRGWAKVRAACTSLPRLVVGVVTKA